MTAKTNPRPDRSKRGKKLVQKLGWALFVGGGYLTPSLAAKAAAKRWCKLPGNAGRRQDNRAEPGQTELVDLGLRSPLAVETWGQGDRLIYLVHGWGGWRGQVASFVPPLVEAGFKVIAFDALSHGESGPGEHGPTHSSGGEMIASLEAVVAHYGQPFGVIAHSLGCGSVCRAILDGKVKPQRMALISPNPDMDKVAQRFGRTLGFPPRTMRLLQQTMEQWAHRAMTDFDVPSMGATGEMPPTLVIHDQSDKEAPYQIAQQIHRQWGDAQMVLTNGLGHHRILISQAVIRDAAQFVTA